MPENSNLWPLKGATVKLVRNITVKVSGGAWPPFHQPPTINGEIRIGMECGIFVPGLDAQIAGFTPYKLVDGRAVDATRELLAHYAGIYKKIR